jgi:hypothetical protein
VEYQPNTKVISSEFVDLVNRCLIDEPEKTDLNALKKQLNERPEMWQLVYDFTYMVRSKLMEKISSQEVVQIGIRANILEMKNDFEYRNSPMVERLLIDNVINCWLRYQWVEFTAALKMGKAVTIREIQFWEKRLSATQRRYLRAVETLARVRKITRQTPVLQVNIATDGGQQINVVGDLVKETEQHIRG